MTKGRIIIALVFLAVVLVYGAVYVFYFSPKKKAYEQDERFLVSIERLAEDLEESFYRTDPEEITRQWRGEVQPWADAVEERAQYFNFSDWYEHEMPPEGGGILRFWYQETSNKMITDLYKKVTEKLPRYDLFPVDIRSNLNIKNAEDFSATDAKRRDFNRELNRLSYGISVAELLLDSRASSVRDIVVWPVRNLESQNNLLNLQTVGLSFTMLIRDLVKFLDELRAETRYINIDGIQIAYPYIMDPAQPHLEVKLLLTQASFAQQKAAAGGNRAPAVGGPAAGGAESAYNDRVNRILQERRAQQTTSARSSRRGSRDRSALERAWVWFKKRFIPF